MAKTKTEKIIDGLTKSYGMVEEKCRSGKYRMFKWTSKDDDKVVYYFVGSNAGLRFNTRPVVTGSVSVAEPSKLEIIKRGEAACE